jgi:hypothetical protein
MKAVAHGKSVGVNAAEALFFIRNSQNGVLVGEDGKIKVEDIRRAEVILDEDALDQIQKEIMEFQVPGREKKDVQKLPAYIESVVHLKDGARRFVYTK